MEVKLLTNGVFEYFPKYVYMKTFKVKHIRMLDVASDEGVNEVLTEILDDVIDFEKTGIIKSSSDLCIQDRLWLFFNQRVQFAGDVVKVNYKCNRCGNYSQQNISLKNLEEKYLTKISDYSKFKYKLIMPSYRKYKEFEEEISNYIKSLDINNLPDFITKDETGNLSVSDDFIKYLYVLLFIDGLNIENFVDKINFVMDMDINDLTVILKFAEEIKLDFKFYNYIKCPICGDEGKKEIPITNLKIFF